MKISCRQPSHQAGEVLVKFRFGLDQAGLERVASEHGARLIERLEMPSPMRENFGGDLVRLSVPQADAEVLKSLQADARVCYAERNALLYRPMQAQSGSPVPVLAQLDLPKFNRPSGFSNLALRPAHREILMGVGGAALVGAGGALIGSLWGRYAGSLAGSYAGGLALALAGGLAGCWLGRSLANREESPESPQARWLPPNLDGRQWALDNHGGSWGKADADIDAPEAWALTRGSRAPIIAMLDTGVDYTHPALAGNLWRNPEDGSYGFNAIEQSHDPIDLDSHGTHCSGIVAANGKDGIYGVSPEARLMTVKIMNDKGTMADAIKGLAFATEHGARITSNSWTSPVFSQAFHDALAASPALHILAAGNDGVNLEETAIYPARYDLPNTLRVAATDRQNRLYRHSNFSHKHVDTAAPGQDITSCRLGGGYYSQSGTSMAAPMVTGVANLILARHPDLSNAELKERLMRVTRVPSLCWKVQSGGVLNAARAVKD